MPWKRTQEFPSILKFPSISRIVSIYPPERGEPPPRSRRSANAVGSLLQMPRRRTKRCTSSNVWGAWARNWWPWGTGCTWTSRRTIQGRTAARRRPCRRARKKAAFRRHRRPLFHRGPRCRFPARCRTASVILRGTRWRRPRSFIRTSITPARTRSATTRPRLII